MSTDAELPKGWCWAAVEDLLVEKLCNGISVRGSDSPPGVPALKLSALGDTGLDYSDRRYIPIGRATAGPLFVLKDDFFVARGNGSLHLVGRGTLAQSPPESLVFPDTMIRLRLATEGSLRRFVAWLWQSSTVRQQIEARARTSAGVYKISQGDIENIRIPLAPLTEQRRIVAKIEELFSQLDAGVAALGRVRAGLKRYRAAVLKAAVEGRLTADWRARHPAAEPADRLLERIRVERRRRWEDAQRTKFVAAGKEPPKGWPAKYQEPTGPDSAALPELPAGWCWASVDALIREPLRNGNSSRESETGNGIRTLTLTAVTLGDFSERNTKLTVADEAQVADLWLVPGDYFIERSNTPELVGISRLYKGPKQFAIFPDLLIRVRFTAEIHHSYPEVVLLSEPARVYFRKRAKGLSGSMPKIDQGTILRLPIPLPPLAEQAEIVAEVERRLSVASAVEAAVAANLRRAERLRRSILKRAFAGRLVPQDPADEPADQLLARIRADRGRPAEKKPALRRPPRGQPPPAEPA